MLITPVVCRYFLNVGLTGILCLMSTFRTLCRCLKLHAIIGTFNSQLALSLMSFWETTLIVSSDRQYLGFNPLTVHNFSFSIKKSEFDISGLVFCSENKSSITLCCFQWYGLCIAKDRSINNNNKDLHGMCMEGWLEGWQWNVYMRNDPANHTGNS